MKKSTLLILTAGVWIGLETFSAISNSQGPPAANTGAPGEGICTDCHSDNALNSGSAVCTFTYQFGASDDTLYTPGESGMNTHLSLTESGSERSGFQMVALDNKTNQSVGWFNFSQQKVGRSSGKVGGKTRNYVNHVNATNDNPGGMFWGIQWDPPNWNVGRITFYVAYNGSDADGTSNGDFIYTKKFTIDHYLGWKVGFNKNLHNDLKYGVYPSTVSDALNVTYTNPTTQPVSIELIGLDGKKAATLASGNPAAGEVNSRFELPAGIASGMYLVKLTAGQQELTKKIFVNR